MFTTDMVLPRGLASLYNLGANLCISRAKVLLFSISLLSGLSTEVVHAQDQPGFFRLYNEKGEYKGPISGPAPTVDRCNCSDRWSKVAFEGKSTDNGPSGEPYYLTMAFTDTKSGCQISRRAFATVVDGVKGRQKAFEGELHYSQKEQTYSGKLTTDLREKGSTDTLVVEALRIVENKGDCPDKPAQRGKRDF